MAVVVEVDGSDCTQCVQSGSVTRRLNKPAQATMRMFSDCAPGTSLSRAKVSINGDLYFHGFITQISTEAGEDGNLMSEYTCEDPMFLWNFRPARAGPDSEDPGDFSNPKLYSDPSVNGMGPQILQQILLQSEVDTDPGFGEGPLFIDLAGSSFAAGIPGLLLADPTDFPIQIMEVFEHLASTGRLDVIVNPIDSGGNMATLTVMNGDYGNELQSSIFFDYATGNHNVRQLRMTESSANICNKLWYYLGPRVKTPRDPGSVQHWRANITGNDGGVEVGYPGPPDGLAYLDHDPSGPGGESVDETNTPVGPPWTVNPLGERIYNSRQAAGVRMDVQIFDAQGDENPSAYREMYRRLWQMESWIRAIPRTLVHITPVRTSDADLLPPGVDPIEFGTFDIGDSVAVSAGAIVRGGFSGSQRIYGYTVNWDENGILELGELLTSADQEGTGG